jgi:hypothetical protein
MSKRRVVNYNVHPFTQEYKGEMISLAAKGKGKNFIDLEQDDAIQFVGQMSPMKFDVDGNPTPEGFKMLEIEQIPDGVGPETEKETVVHRYVCQKCRFVAETQEALDAHVDAEHLSDLADEDEREKRVAAIAKRGRGRPPKGESKNGVEGA